MAKKISTKTDLEKLTFVLQDIGVPHSVRRLTRSRGQLVTLWTMTDNADVVSDECGTLVFDVDGGYVDTLVSYGVVK